MNWAKERADKIFRLFPVYIGGIRLRKGMRLEIAIALQRVADECANETVIANQLGLRPYDAIRARFPKEEL